MSKHDSGSNYKLKFNNASKPYNVKIPSSISRFTRRWATSETIMLQNLLKVTGVNVVQRKCKIEKKKKVIQGNHLHLSLNSFRSDMIQVTKIPATRAKMVKRSNA